MIDKSEKKSTVLVCFVYHVLTLYNNTGDIVDWLRSEQPRTACTEKVVEAVRARINQSSVHQQKTIAKEMNIAPRTLSYILKDDLGLLAFKRRTGQLLTSQLRALQCERVKNYFVCMVSKNTKKYCSQIKKFLQQNKN